MSLLNNLKNIKFKKEEKPKNENIEYLNNLKKIVGRGLAELYKIQPKNPITFLAEWLNNEAENPNILIQIEENKKNISILEQKYEEKQKILEEKKAEEERKNEEIQKEKDELENTIINCEDFEDHLNEICEKFKKIIGATGIYISKYDLKRVYPLPENADENGHIDPANIKVLQYVNWCEDHSFLDKKFLEPGTGVTYKLINPNDEEGEEGEEEKKEEANDDEEENEDKKEEPKEEVLNNIEIEEVVNEPKINFFREPRLGSYIAIDIRYQSSMQYSSLTSAIENLNEYKVKKEEQDKRLAEKAEEEKENEGKNEEKNNEENEEEEEDNNNKDENKEEGGEEEEENEDDKPVVLKDFDKEEKIYILSIDTMGQEKVYNEEEKKYILKIAKLIRDSMTNLEIKLLEKDRDLRIEYLNIEKPIKEEYDDDRIASEQDNAVKEYEGSDEFDKKNITDEDEKAVDFEMCRARTYMNLIFNTDMIKLLEMFEQFEFVQYEKLFQNLFFFAKTPGEDINEPDTHKLSWKKSRKLWKDLINKLKEYDPIGPKPESVDKIYKGNVILKNLQDFVNEKEQLEELSNYSFSLVKLVQFCIAILKVRKQDILRRYKVKKGKEKERNDIIAKNKQLEEDRANALQEAKEEFDKAHEEEEKEEEEEEEEEEEKEGEEKEGEEKEGEEKEGEEKEGEEKEGEEKEGEEKEGEEKEGEEKEGEEKEGEEKEGEEKEKEEGEEGEEKKEEGEEGEEKKEEGEEKKEEGEEGEEKKEEGEEKKEEGEEGEEKKEEGEEGEEKKEGEEGEEGEEKKEGEEGEEGEEKEEDGKKKKKKKKKEKPPKPVFDEKGFLEQYDEEHPKLEVPPEVVYDIDGDFDVNFEGDGEEEDAGEEEGEEED